jgi:site-specific DNA-methyltransferase (adenine-specific)
MESAVAMAVYVTSQPDILEVISDLSNDEVFTPPRVANAVLDLLPEEVWSNPDLRWLDPGCKTGVFLRESAKRLMKGLAPVIPRDEARLEHIFTNMLHGIAITELTSLMARRTLYCSKDASSSASAVRMPTRAGRVWFESVPHEYVNGRCKECSASESGMERENRDNYAYAFIHAGGQSALDKEFDMRFDVIVGNPPYQMEAEGGTRTIPLYNLFVEQAKALNPKYIAMIIPSRWMAGGLGLSEFRETMLGDQRMRKLVDFSRMDSLFPGVDFEGGVCYFLWDREHSGTCEVTTVHGDISHGPVPRDLREYDVFVRDGRALTTLDKVLRKGEPSMTRIMATNNEFGIASNFTEFRQNERPGDVALHYNRQGKRLVGWIGRAAVPKSSSLIDRWKVMVPKSYGERGTRPALILGPTFLASPPSVSTQTYVLAHADTEAAARHIESYFHTRFFRFLLSLRKISQHAPVQTYRWVPQQTWDRDWTDPELYEKYGITQDEQAYIAEMIREM